MKMLEIAALANGAHRSQTFHGVLPDGWAVIPADMECENFPFGEVTVEAADGVLTVTGWTPDTIPESSAATEPAPDEVPSAIDVLEAQVTYTAMMTDTLLEV